jgi:hypothetical protein
LEKMAFFHALSLGSNDSSTVEFCAVSDWNRNIYQSHIQFNVFGGMFKKGFIKSGKNK